ISALFIALFFRLTSPCRRERCCFCMALVVAADLTLCFFLSLKVCSPVLLDRFAERGLKAVTRSPCTIAALFACRFLKTGRKNEEGQLAIQVCAAGGDLVGRPVCGGCALPRADQCSWHGQRSGYTDRLVRAYDQRW